MSEDYDIEEFHSRMSYLEILSLADSFEEDEFGNSVFSFNTPQAKAVLSIYTNDKEVNITLTTPNDSEPIVKLKITQCKSAYAVNDSCGKYIEFTGNFATTNHSLGTRTEKQGFRLTLAPHLCLEPFFKVSSN